jgi:hypothetical protein
VFKVFGEMDTMEQTLMLLIDLIYLSEIKNLIIIIWLL